MRSPPTLHRSADGAALVARLAAGDVRALGPLYDTFGAIAYSLAVAVAKDPVVAEDVVTDVFVHLSQVASEFDPAHTTVAAWLGGRVRRRALAARPGERISPAVTRLISEVRPIESVAVEEIVPAVNGAAQWRAKAHQALSALPVDERRVVELAYFDGLGIGEIATALEEPASAVRRRLRSGLNSLRATLSPDGDVLDARLVARA